MNYFTIILFINVLNAQLFNQKYIFYDVSPSEGFNLRRDVYIRVINLARLLERKGYEITVVLPPFVNLYHWFNQGKSLSWKEVFDLNSLNQVVKVKDFLSIYKKNTSAFGKINYAFILQNHPAINIGDFTPKADFVNCDVKAIKKHIFNSLPVGKSLCVNILMDINEFSSVIDEFWRNTSSKSLNSESIYIHDAEKLIHGIYSEWSAEYWTVRRSMQFNRTLIELARKYITRKGLGNGTELSLLQDWRLKHDVFLGEPYLGVHLRRQDFIWSRAADQFASIEEVIKNITWFAEKYQLDHVFLATDSPIEERETIEKQLRANQIATYFYQSNQNLHPAQLAIIDQIICSYARVFVGTYQSTFTNRIFEERQIMHMPVAATYNYICPSRIMSQAPATKSDDQPDDCSVATEWPVIYEPEFTYYSDNNNYYLYNTYKHKEL